MRKKRSAKVVKFPNPSMVIRHYRGDPPVLDRLNGAVDAVIDCHGFDSALQQLEDLVAKMKAYRKRAS